MAGRADDLDDVDVQLTLALRARLSLLLAYHGSSQLALIRRLLAERRAELGYRLGCR